MGSKILLTSINHHRLACSGALMIVNQLRLDTWLSKSYEIDLFLSDSTKIRLQWESKRMYKRNNEQ